MPNITYNGLIKLLMSEGINSKDIILNALENASSKELKGFAHSINVECAKRIMKEREEKK